MKIFLLLVLFLGLVSSLPLSKREDSSAAPAGELKLEEIHNEQDPNLALVAKDAESKPESPAADTKSETPAADAKSETPAADAKSESPAAEVKPEAAAAENKSETPAAEAKSETPTADAKSETPVADAKSESPAAEVKPEAAAAENKSENPATEAKSDAPATEAKSDTPAAENKSETPAGETKPAEVPATEVKSEAPAAESEPKKESLAAEVQNVKEPAAPETKEDHKEKLIAPEVKAEEKPVEKPVVPELAKEHKKPVKPEEDAATSLTKTLALSQILSSITKTLGKRSTDGQEAESEEDMKRSEDSTSSVEEDSSASKSEEDSSKSEEELSKSEEDKLEETRKSAERSKGRSMSPMASETSLGLKKRGSAANPWGTSRMRMGRKDAETAKATKELEQGTILKEEPITKTEELNTKKEETSTKEEGQSGRALTGMTAPMDMRKRGTPSMMRTRMAKNEKPNEGQEEPMSGTIKEEKKARALAAESPADMRKRGTMGIPMMMRRRMTRDLEAEKKSTSGEEGEEEDEDQGGEDKGKKHAEKPELLGSGTGDASKGALKSVRANKFRRDTSPISTAKKGEIPAGELVITEKKERRNFADTKRKITEETEKTRSGSEKTGRDFKGSDVHPKTAILLTVEGRRNAQLKLKETIAKMSKEAEFKSTAEPIPVSAPEDAPAAAVPAPKMKSGRAILKNDKMQKITENSHLTALLPESEKTAPEPVKILSQDAIKQLIAKTRGSMRMRRSDNYAPSSSDQLLVEDMLFPTRSAQKVQFAVRNRAPEKLRLAVEKEMPLLVESPKILVRDFPAVRELPTLRESYGSEQVMISQEAPDSEVRLLAPTRTRLLETAPPQDFNVQVVKPRLRLAKESILLKSNDDILIESADRQQYGRNYDEPTRTIVREEPASYSAPTRALLKEEPAQIRAIVREEPASYSAPTRALLKESAPIRAIVREEPASYSAPTRALLKEEPAQIRTIFREEPASYSAPTRALLKEEPAQIRAIVREEPASYSAPTRALLKEEPATMTRIQFGRSYEQPARAIVREEPASYAAPARAILKEEPASYAAAPAPIRISAEPYEEPAAAPESRESRYRRDTMPKRSHMQTPLIIEGKSQVRRLMAMAAPA